MSLYLDRLVRICPPRSGSSSGAGAQRMVSVSNVSAATELDTDLFTLGSAAPGGYGRALVKFKAEGGDCYVLLGSSNAVTANATATSGNTVPDYIPAGQSETYEIDPQVDKFVAAVTKTGTATLRYRIVSFPTNSGNPG